MKIIGKDFHTTFIKVEWSFLQHIFIDLQIQTFTLGETMEVYNKANNNEKTTLNTKKK